MKNKIIVANLKKAMSSSEVAQYIKKLELIDSSHLVIFPSTIYLPYFLKHSYSVGVQNVFYQNCTGEITPKQVRELGIQYVMVGHSDRRKYLKEDHVLIQKKIKACIKYGLQVILCIGESKEERDLLKTSMVIKNQIHEVLKDIPVTDQIVIAYEPIWAIGTSVLPSMHDIEDAIFYIKSVASKEGFDDISVLYGGSVSDKNVNSILNMKGIDGIMVGTSAISIDQFLHLIEVAYEK